MQESPSREPLESVLITEQLFLRPYRGPDYRAENQALVALMGCLAADPRSVLALLAEKAMELCHAHSAGISIEEGLGRDGKSPDAIFRWHAIAGAWSKFQGGTLPRWDSPCGAVLEQDRSLLIAHPARHWDFPPDMVPTITEALLVPFRAAAAHDETPARPDPPASSANAPCAAGEMGKMLPRPVGTVWVLAHDRRKSFDREDLRLMESLAAFAGAAYFMLQRIGRG
jgi:GAF domain-containing protein